VPFSRLPGPTWRRPRAPLLGAEYPLLAVGGIVFVRATPGHDNGFARYLEELDRTHFIVTGFDLSVGATEEAVIENAFDQRHFGTVHGVKASGFAVWTREDGGLEVEGTMSVPIAAAGGEVSESVASYRGRVFSPGIAAVELQGPQRYTIVTGATNTPRPGGCVVRISLAYPRSIWPAAPTPAAYEPLLKYSRRGLEQDRMIWDNLLPIATPGWMPEDEPARVFHRFCARHASG